MSGISFNLNGRDVHFSGGFVSMKTRYASDDSSDEESHSKPYGAVQFNLNGTDVVLPAQAIIPTTSATNQTQENVNEQPSAKRKRPNGY